MENHKSNWEVHKFGGSSLANAQLFNNVSEILSSVSKEKKACVVSAIEGVTDLLTEASYLAKENKHKAVFEKIKKKHFDIIEKLLEKPHLEKIKKVLLKDFEGLDYIFKTIGMSKLFSENIREVVTGHGELWSAQILNELLKQKKISSQWINARDVLFLDSNTTPVRVSWDLSEKKIKQKLTNINEKIIVVTGYVASTINGVPTTLKRNGSDISASIFGNLLGASSISIWSDVNGIMSANPQYVPRAGVLKQVSYDEAMEMAYFGAKILHPHTLSPAMKKKIPIRIRNTSNQNHPGTLIGETHSKSKKIIKGLSNVNNLAVINVEGTNMIGVPGMAHRVFGSLKEKELSVVLISQASSEHSICFCVPYEQAKIAQKVLEEEFYRELKEQQIGSVSVIGPCSIMAAVGENMNNTPGVASTFFRALGKSNINVRAIAQGSSERNISAVIDQKDVKKAMKAVHAGFYLSPQTLSIGLIGPGLIGKAILNQLRDQKELLKEKFDFDFRIRGICNSKSMLLDDDQIDLKDWEENFKRNISPINYDEFIKSIQTDEIPHTCLIDCTANNEMARAYPEWIKRGIHIITPNKKANSLEYSLYEDIKKLLDQKKVQYFYEATVGAGLPIISTLKDLIQTGDEVLGIEGVFSGTLSYIFNNFSEKKSFSSIVKEAKEMGLTEPDPREDLSGMDVARKAIILAREMGQKLDVEDIEIENIVPHSLRDISSKEEFMNKIGECDSYFEDKRVEAEKKGSLLKYGVEIDPIKGIKVKLKEYSLDHPFSSMKDSDNIILFKTKRYNERPLVIQGPGAGPQVTAAGIFSDLIRLANVLGKDQ